MARTQVATFEVISTTPNPSTISDGRNKHSRGEADFLIENHGSIFGFTPLNANARIWLDENVQAESWQFMGATLMVEHRYAMGLALGIESEGFKVE